MITSITSTNKQAYKNLFDKANAELKNNPKFNTPITTLEEYFVWLPTLAKYTGNINHDRYYTILPLDEGYFEIDANTRRISIPDNFRKNGIAVQGDRGAETIYFRINRYFDHQDLNECEIYIQWEETRPNGDSGIATDFVRDIESDKDYLIFGWPLLEDVTAQAGNIKFSIRFIKLNKDGSLDYSFSTLDSTATINPAIQNDYTEFLGLSGEYQKIYQQMIDNLTEADRTGDNVALEPYYVIMLLDDDGDFTQGAVDSLNDLKNQSVIEPYEKDFSETNKLYFAVSANTDDTGTLEYLWLKDNEPYDVETKTKYVPTKDENSENDKPLNKIYYKANGDQLKIDYDDTWETLRYENGYDTKDENGNYTDIIYEQIHVIEITEVGEYISKVTNTVSETNSISQKTSRTLKIPGPTVPVGLVTQEQNIIATITDDVVNTIELLSNVTPIENTTYEFKWFKGEEPLTEQTGSNCIINYGSEGSYNNSAQGIYKVKVRGERNGAYTEELTSANYIVTFPALKPTITDISIAANGNLPRPNEEIAVDYTLDNLYTQLDGLHTIEIIWYNDSEGKIEAHRGSTHTYTSPGTYSVKVVNTYNTDVKSELKAFIVNQ